jgi:ABC-2 type transport system permease protein
MTIDSDIMPEAGGGSPAFGAEATAAVGLTPTRPFYWSVRRELWEYRSIYIAPLAAAAVVLFGFLIGAVNLPEAVRHYEASHGVEPTNQLGMAAMAVMAATALVVIVTGVIVGMFYCLGALHNERRDRSLLFWKSLPVSDLTAVAAKAAVPLVVLPLVSVAVVAAMHVIMLLVGTAALLLNNIDPMPLWTQLPFLQLALALVWGAVVTPLWLAPIYGWLFLVSAWAKRAPFLWAALTPLAIIVIEGIAFRTHHFVSLIGERLTGAFGAGFVHVARGPDHRPHVPEIDVVGFLASPGLWIGLAVAAAFLAGAVWMRRTREPT